MKTFSARQVKKVLIYFGLKPTRGNGTGHEIWQDAAGRICRPVLRKKDCSYEMLFNLALEMSGKGIIASRKHFFTTLNAI